MSTRTYVVGDQVIDIAEGRTGTIVDGFAYRDCDDGYPYPQPPPHDWLPIEWDGGRLGYRPVSALDYQDYNY